MSHETYFYCHGAPGSPLEIGKTHPALHCLQRFDAEGSYDQAVLSGFDAAARTPVVVVGFSLGAMAALRIAAHRPNLVSRVVLASAAAPLELGDFLPHMAGRAVFEVARRGPLTLRALSAAQAMVARLAPEAMIAAMFQGVSASERALLQQREFKRVLGEALNRSLGPSRAAYCRDVLAYVSPWSGRLADIQCPVTLIHGTDDRWAPIAMAHELARALGDKAVVRALGGHGHYSTLYEVLGGLGMS